MLRLIALPTPPPGAIIELQGDHSMALTPGPPALDSDIVREFFRRLAARDRNGCAALLHQDATWEFPFARAGGPRFVNGKRRIEAFFRGFLGTFDPVGFEDVEVIPALEPGLVFATYGGRMQVAATGRAYNNTYIAILRLQGGLIRSVREYFNPDVVAGAFTPA